MRICIVISNPSIGGAQKVSITLAHWLSSHKHQVCIIGVQSTALPTYDFDKINYYELNKGNKFIALHSKLKDFKPDVVLTMGIPLCLYTVPVCLSLHLKHVISERNDPAHFKGKITTKIFSRIIMRLANSYVFQTKGAQQYYGGNIAKKSIIIPNPLFNVAQMPSEPYVGNRQKNIISVGRLNQQKNQILLINAFNLISNKYPNYKLIIWGEGEERTCLESHIKKLGLQNRVFLPGNTKNLIDKIYDSSLFVLSSDFEGMPNALMEAMALGIPSISTDCPCGGPSELIKNNENGILVPVGDTDGLAFAMDNILSNPEKAKRIGNESFKIRYKYNIDHICKIWYDYLSSQ